MTKTSKKSSRILNCMVDWDTKSVVKDASGKMTIKGYANTPDKDRVSDVILPSAFNKSLAAYLENPVLLFQHNWDKIIGKTVVAKVTDNGLYVECEISGAKDVEDVKTKILEGSLKTFSIGYNEIDSDYDDEHACNVIKELELLEISVVTIPCNPKAKFTTEVEEKQVEEVETKSAMDEGFFDFLAEALKGLTTTDDIDGDLLKEIHSIYEKGGPGSGRKPGSGGGKKPSGDKKPKGPKPSKTPPKENSNGSFAVKPEHLAPRTSFTTEDGTTFHVSKNDGNTVTYTREDSNGDSEEFEVEPRMLADQLSRSNVHEMSNPDGGHHRSSAGQAAEDAHQSSRRE